MSNSETAGGRRPKARSASVADMAAEILRKEIISRIDGDPFLGSEDEIAQDLGVSKPSLRQATRLLEAEQILEVRRGVGGGLYIRKPSEGIVLRTVDLYLTARQTPFHEIVRATIPLRVEAVRNVAANPDAAIRGRPLALLEGSQAAFFESEGDAFARAATDFSELLAELAGNSTLTLFNRVLLTYGHRYPYGVTFTPLRCRKYATTLKDAAIAIANGRADEAAIAIRHGMEQLAGWTESVSNGSQNS